TCPAPCISQTKNGRPSAVTPPEAHSLLSNRRLSTVQRGWSELWVVTWAASAMDRLERKLSGAVFNASIPQPKCTEYSPPVHHFTLPAPEYRRSHVAVKFRLRGGDYIIWKIEFFHRDAATPFRGAQYARRLRHAGGFPCLRHPHPRRIR